MDANKTGALIRQLRMEKGMTQREVARQLMVSEQAVSKWERALGCPDVSLLRSLANVLDVDVRSLLAGERNESIRDGGNMKRIQFYVCPACGNVITATGGAQISCCGRQLEAMKPQPCDEAHAIRIEHMDGEMHIAFDHGMEKVHHIRFIAVAGYDRVLLVRLYPEQGSETRVPYLPRAMYYIGCSRDGLFTLKL
ncbi:MAG: helix-turn-helix domain-containing protein [Clostridia bacterium]|nr:helix-turn-helix domain-containing protein [Clostridia bacterium]